MNIPFVDLKAQHNEIEHEIKQAMAKVFEHGAFVSGPEVSEFENNFARYLKAKHCIGVGNGTDALFIALKCMGIGIGDEVITVANSFVATSEAISLTGAQVIFADCNEETFNIDFESLKSKISAKTKAIIPVHLYGQPVNMERIMFLAKEHGLYVIEDAAQAHGAMFQDKKVGTIGHVGCFSFYPSKNLGAYGDGGGIVTNDDKLAEKIRMYADHGRKSKYDHELEGCNSKLDTLQAAFLNVKLKYLDQWTERRVFAAKLYNTLLKDMVKTPSIISDATHAYHLYVIRIENRDRVRELLAEKGISTGIHYPIPLPFLSAYDHLKYKASEFPVANKLKDEILSLPMYEFITQNQLKYVAEQLQEIVN